MNIENTKQSECMKLNPKSIFPYLLYAEILIENKKYKEAIEVLNIVQKKKQSYNAEHNLWFCKYHLWDYKWAEEHFMKCIWKDDKKLKSKFWLILVDYRLWRKKQVYKGIEEMKKSDFFDNAINNYDIWFFYFLYNDFDSVKDLFLELKMNIDLVDRKEFWYSVFKADRKLFNKTIIEWINELQGYVDDVNTEDDYESEEERQENIKYWLEEMDKKKNIVEKFKRKPRTNINKQLVSEYYGCSMFGCYHCWNHEEDELTLTI